MNCKKCGKEIDYEAEVCNECVAAEASVEPAVEEVASAEGVVAVNVADNKKGKMVGFGKALTSLILPIIGALFIGIVCGILVVMAEEAYETFIPYLKDLDLIKAQPEKFEATVKAFLENDLGSLVIVLLLFVGACVVAFVMSIVGIIFGAQSIGCFKKESKNGNKPLPALILGIAGLVESAGMVLGLLAATGSVALIVFTVLKEVL